MHQNGHPVLIKTTQEAFQLFIDWTKQYPNITLVAYKAMFDSRVRLLCVYLIQWECVSMTSSLDLLTLCYYVENSSQTENHISLCINGCFIRRCERYTEKWYSEGEIDSEISSKTGFDVGPLGPRGIGNSNLTVPIAMHTSCIQIYYIWTEVQFMSNEHSNTENATSFTMNEHDKTSNGDKVQNDVCIR